jgi:hypothetical protein
MRATLLVKHRVSHGTVLLGCVVSHGDGSVTLQKDFDDGQLRYVCNIAGGLR